MAQKNLALWVAVENIALFQGRLKSPADEGQRNVLDGLLARELAKHKAILDFD